MAVRKLKIDLNNPNGGTISSEVVEKLRIKTWQTPRVGKLPVGYTELDYIESDGTQYIDTNIIPTLDTKVDVDCMLTSASYNQTIIGSRTETAKDMYYIQFLYSSKVYRFGLDSKSVVGTIDEGTIFNFNRLVKAGNKNFVNDIEVTSNSATTLASQCSLYLFGCNNKQTPNDTTKFRGRISSCKIWQDGDNLSIDFIPCINPQGEVGMYDMVSQSFFGNNGTGTFLAGDVVSKCISDEEITKFKIGTDLVFGEEEPQIQWIDLGLPSGTLWADRNLGANSPNEYGTNYAWGETETKETFTTANYFLGDITSATELQSLGVIDTEYYLTDTYDVCKVKLGGECSMPTQTQAQELVTNTILSIEEVEGQNIAVLTSKINGRAIRMPLSGLNGGKSYLNERLYYWTKYKTNPLTDNDSGHVLRVIRGNANAVVTSYRMYSGLNVRAINNRNCIKWVDMGADSILYADRFLGTDDEHPYGRYYAWGEIETKDSYTKDNYQFNGMSREELQSAGVIDSSKITGSYDVANQKLGYGITMPVYSDITWLYNNTTATFDGKSVILTSIINGNSITLQLAGAVDANNLYGVGELGRIWMRTYTITDSVVAPYVMTLSNSGKYMSYTSVKQSYRGNSVLPVKKKNT